jgi:hypothetical protein
MYDWDLTGTQLKGDWGNDLGASRVGGLQVAPWMGQGCMCVRGGGGQHPG